MKPKIAILGASLGGLIAAAELRASGFNVDIFEKGRSVGGLFSEVETPFGPQNWECMSFMQTNDKYEYLCNIFGSESFHLLLGSSVDKGASANFNSVYFGNTIHTCFLTHYAPKSSTS